MRNLPFVLMAAMLMVATGCYHAMVTTGLTPSTVVIDETFASGWVYGLVPPKTVETAAKCTDGVAMVETELSFVNQLVSFITFGIYTPMHIKVTCAMAGSASAVSTVPTVTLAADSGAGDVIAGFMLAADRAVDTGGPVYVRFDAPLSD